MKISEQALRGVVQPPVPVEVDGKICPSCLQKIPSKRNRERMALFFALLKEVFYQWPETPDEDGIIFTPHDTEDLRYHVLCKAGHCDVTRIEMIPGNKRQNINAMIAFHIANRDKKGIQYKPYEHGIMAMIPRSIARANCTEQVFKDVLDRALEYIELKLGVTVEQLKREGRNKC